LIRGAIFDLGMTLVQFTGEWNSVLEESWQSLVEYLLSEGYNLNRKRFIVAFRELFESRVYERAVSHIEQPTAEIFQQVMNQFGHSDLSSDVIERAMECFYSVSEEHWKPKQGVKEVLDELKEDGLRLGLISNAGDVPNVRRLLDKGKIAHYFDPLLVSAAEGIRKPHVELFHKVQKAWDMPADQIVMIGDNLMEDILGAQRAGIHQIWLKEHVDTLQNHEISEQIHPETITANFKEIPKLIREMGREE
jgi:putative hydrolase of the HAD superfamily